MRRPTVTRATTIAGGVAVALLIPSLASGVPGFASLQTVPSVRATSASDAGAYGSVSCATATSCTAVGPSINQLTEGFSTDSGHPTAVTWTNGTWGSPAPLATPHGGRTQFLNGVACPAIRDCVAVGGRSVGERVVPLIETEAAGTWSASSSIAPPVTADGQGEFSSVWCASIGKCVAFGLYPSGSSFGAMASVESSGRWARASGLSNGSEGSEGLILPESLSCADVSNCTAIGLGVPLLVSQVFSTYAWKETAGVWSVATEIPQPRGREFIGVAVACPTASTCLAGGAVAHGPDGTLEPAIAVETRRAWTAARRIALPRVSPTATGGLFTSLACGSPSSCEAVGSLLLPSACHGLSQICTSTSAPTASMSSGGFLGIVGGQQFRQIAIDRAAPLAATWSDGVWSSLGVLHGTKVGAQPATFSGFGTVECSSAQRCLALGLSTVASRDGLRSSAFSVDLLTVRTAPPLVALRAT